MLIKDLFVAASMAWDPRCLRMVWRVHKDFSGQKDYSPWSLARALWLVARSEKIVKHEGAYIITSFLPPIPSPAFDQVYLATPGKRSRFDEHANAERTAPISLFISVTNRCLYDCWHCSKDGREPQSEMSTAELQALVRSLQNMGVAILGFTGGEPLLRQDLEELISAADSRSVSILYTTGHGLDAQRAKNLKKAGLWAIGISLDSDVPEEVDRLRGRPGAYDTAVSAVRTAKAAGLHTMVQTVATHALLARNGLWAVLSLAKELGADEMRVLESMPTGRLAEGAEREILSATERQTLKDFHRKANWSGRWPKVSSFAHIEDETLFGCGAGTQHSYIDTAGNLYPCDFVPLSFGNIRLSPIAELWAKMNTAMGRPRAECFCHQVHPHLKAAGPVALPLEPETAVSLCGKCPGSERLPGFYRALKGES